MSLKSSAPLSGAVVSQLAGGMRVLVARQLLPGGIYNDRVLPALSSVRSPILVSLQYLAIDFT